MKRGGKGANDDDDGRKRPKLIINGAPRPPPPPPLRPNLIINDGASGSGSGAGGPRVLAHQLPPQDEIFYVTEGPLTLMVQLTYSKRWKSFRSERRLYTVSFDAIRSNLQGSEHLLVNLCLSQILGKLIIKIIEDIRRRHLAAGRSREAKANYFFTAEGLSTPLLTSIGFLFSNTERDDFLERLELTIFSSQTLDIRKKFQIDTTVVDHPNKDKLFWIAGWRFKMPRSWEKSRWYQKQGLHYMPDMSSDDVYKNCCLLAAIAYGIAFNREMESKMRGESTIRWRRLRHINAHAGRDCEQRRALAFETLRLFMDQLVGAHDLDLDVFRNCALDMNLRREADKLHIHLVIIKDQATFAPVFTHPRVYEETRQPIYVLATSLFDNPPSDNYEGNRVYHAVSVLKPNSFVDRILKTKNYCLYCNRMFGAQTIFVHKCVTKYKRCSSCRHILQVPGMYTNHELNKGRCLSESSGERHSCKHCGKGMRNKECLRRHRRHCREDHVMCETCGIVHAKTKLHVCGERYCRLCGITVSAEREHVCQMRKPLPTKKVSPLGFFDTETLLEGSQNKHVVNAVGLSYETRQGVFNDVYFYDDALHHEEDGRVQEEAFTCRYWPETYDKKFKRPTFPPTQKRAFKTFRRTHGFQSEDEEDAEEEDEIEPTVDKTCALGKFVAFILNENFYGYTLIAHNASRFDSMLVLESLMSTELEVKPLFDGCKLLLLEIPRLKLRIIDSYRYCKIPLAKFPERFPQISRWSSFGDEAKGTFPFKFNRRENYDYSGPLPAKEFFVDEHTTEKNLAKYEHFRESWPEDKIWNFKDQFHLYLRQDVKLLRGGCLSLTLELLGFQEEILTDRDQDVEKNDYFHPFSPPYFTLSSFVHKLWQFFELRKNTLFLLENEKNGRLTSKYELEWLSWLVHRGHSIPYSAHTALGQFKLGSYYPDGFNPETKTVYEFLGCAVHFHGYQSPSCELCRKMNRDSTNPFGAKCETVYLNWEKKKEFYAKKGYRVVHIWECEYALKRKDEAKEFLERHYYAERRPRERLRIRSALRGGRVEAFRLLYHQDQNRSTTFRYVDKNSLYPSVAIFETYPVGLPADLFGERLNDVRVENGCFMKGEKAIYGLVQATLVPPDSLFLPVLPFHSSGKLKFGLCRTCVEEMRQDLCRHSDEERSICDVWTSVEILYAIECGYKLVKIWEFKAYETMRPIFKSFYTRLAKMKLESEGFPSHVETDAEKEAYVKELNAHMDGLNLNVESIVKNMARRYFAKQISNIALGKMSQDAEKDCVTYIYSLDKYFEMEYCDPKIRVKSLQPLNEDVAEVRYSPVGEMLGFHRNTQVIIYSFVTAYARIGMLKDMRKLQSMGARIYYTDTDSICFTADENFDKTSLEREFCMNSTKYNAYKDETATPIYSFASLGSKNYSYETQDGETVVKTRGFTLLSPSAKQTLNHGVMKEMLLKFLRGESEEVKSKNFHMKLDRKTQSIYSTTMTKRYTNRTFDKRMLTEKILGRHTENVVTLPFGLKHLNFADCGGHDQWDE